MENLGKQLRRLSIERRVDKLEECVGDMRVDMVSQRIQLDTMEDDLAVYRAAVARREKMAACRENREKRLERQREKAERREKAARQIAVLVILLAVLTLAVVVMASAAKTEERAEPTTAVTVPTSASVLNLRDAVARLEGEEPMEAEKTEVAMLGGSGYFSMAVPLPYEYQNDMRTYCEAYGCPYPLALAVAEVESNFDMDAVGSAGEIGLMQLNPGPGGAYHAELEAAIGLDPTTPAGNIAGGCYLLGKYMDAYNGNVDKVAMAYNMGVSGAKKAWDREITSTDYSDAIMEAVEKWEERGYSK